MIINEVKNLRFVACDKFSIKFPGGLNFQAHLRGGLIEMGNLFERGGLFKFRKDEGISSP